MSRNKQSSEFKNVEGIEYFDFEEDFVEENIRCIPMIVRFKLDKAGIKLKLAEWAKLNTEEKLQLALMPLGNDEEVGNYREWLTERIRLKTGNEALVGCCHFPVDNLTPFFLLAVPNNY